MYFCNNNISELYYKNAFLKISLQVQTGTIGGAFKKKSFLPTTKTKQDATHFHRVPVT